jgi:hypothetical protein
VPERARGVYSGAVGPRSLIVPLVLALAAATAAAQERCPWCKDDPALLAAAGLVGHGPMDVGKPRAEGLRGSDVLRAELPAAQWVFLESAHLRLASALDSESVSGRDRERVEADLARLRAVLPAVPARARKLDPWLRAHLIVMRAEELYARFQKLLAVSDADFPERRGAGPFMGDGPYLGERDKFEIVVHASRRSHQAFTMDLCGVSITDSLRWHLNPPHKLIVSIPSEDADLARDRGLESHVAHNLSHLFLCAYKHFSYDPPIWLDEGLAHLIEKEVDPESTTTDGDEGAMRELQAPSDWPARAAGLAASGKAATFAQLLHAKSFAELSMDAQICAWSRLRFLADEHPERLAAFLGGVKGQLDAQGYPSGEDLPGLQRRLLKELWDWTPADFDVAWTAWVLRQE